MSDETIKKEEIDFCFIITAIGDNFSGVRRSTDGISEAVIKPILSEFKMKPIVAHEISDTGSISDQVIKHIYNDKLAIVNLTGLNSNVMYELGIRFTMRKHTILICEEGTKLPFDIISERTIFYRNDIAGSLELSKKLREMISSIDFESVPNNPIFKVLDYEKAMGDIKKEDFDDALIQRLQNLIENNSGNSKKTTKDMPIYLTMVRFDGNKFSPVPNDLNDSLMKISNLQVYVSKESWNEEQNVRLVKCFRKTDFETAKLVIEEAVKHVFGDTVDLTVLNDDFIY